MTGVSPDKNQIISALFVGKNFNDCLAKMEPVHLQDDLRQEVMVIVCEWSEEKVQGLHEQGKLEFYVVKVILNMLTNKYSQFYKQFRSRSVELVEEVSGMKVLVEDRPDAIAERALREELEDYTISEIDSLYWYDSEMVKLYMKTGTFRAMQKETGIPYVSCYKTVQKALIALKKRVAGSDTPLFTKQELRQIIKPR